jgi:hypothetical protein
MFKDGRLEANRSPVANNITNEPGIQWVRRSVQIADGDVEINAIERGPCRRRTRAIALRGNDRRY